MAGYDTLDTMATIKSLNTLGLTEDEIKKLFRTHEKLEVQRNKDCFMEAAASIHAQCAQTYMTEAERIHAAISMTLCELATANVQSPPLECAPFSQSMQSDRKLTTERSRRDCVEALSRSAQFWSSYSGYLREIPQLCFTFGRWNDVDLARDTYRNATLEKLAFLQHLFQRERLLEAQLSTWTSGLSELRELTFSLSALSQGLSELPNSIETIVQHILGKNVPEYLEFINDYLTRRELDDMRHAQQMNASLSRITDLHAQKLQMLIPHFRTTLQEQLGPIFSGIRVAYDVLLKFPIEVQTERANLVNLINEVHESMSEIQRNVNVSFVVLKSLGQEVIVLGNAHRAVSTATKDLQNTISSLTTSTFNEMERLNATVHSINWGLSIPFQRGYGAIMKRVMRQFLSYISFGVTQDFEHLQHSQVFIDALEIFCMVVRGFISASASLFILFYSLQKYLRRFLLRTPVEPTSRRIVTRLLSDPEQGPYMYRGIRRRTFRIPDRLYRP